MRKSAKFLLMLTSAALFICAMTFCASAESGSTGNLTWSVTSANTVITISGEGAMPNYITLDDVPWKNYKSTIKKIVISDGVTDIGSYAFYGCTAATSVSISDTVTSIGKFSFMNNTALTSITIPTGVKNIEDSAFYGCSNLSVLNFNAKNCEKAGSLSYPIFKNCNSLSTINIGDGVQDLPDYCFAYTLITSIKISDNIKTVGEGVFFRCYNLKNVDMSFKTNSISERAFRECTSLETFNMPELVTSIGAQAFYGCTSLKELDLSYHVVSIGADAFKNTTLTVNTTTDAYAYKYCSVYGISLNATQPSYGDIGGGSETEVSVITNTDFHYLDNDLTFFINFNETLSSECVHIAFYNSSNKVIDYKIVPLSIASDHAYIVTEDRPGASYVKIFVWDSLETCRPVSNVEKITISRP